jgi:hypothetical protein
MSSLPHASFHPELAEPSIPIEVKWIPLSKPALGGITRYHVEVVSHFDPDLVRHIKLEYYLPPQLRRPASLQQEPVEIRKSGRTRQELGFIIPDEARYEIRARAVLTMRNGRRIAQTAVRWIDLGEPEPTPRMIRRIVTRDGGGIRVYQGVAVGGGNE